MNILLAVDISESEFAEAIARTVLSHRWSDDAVFRIVFAIDPFAIEYYESFIETQEVAQKLRDNANSSVDAFVARLRSLGIKHELSAEIGFGHPTDVILEQARKWPADMIFVGSHGRRGFNRLFMGSVSSSVATNSPCSIFIVSTSPSKTDDGEGNREAKRVLVPVAEEEFAKLTCSFLCEHVWGEGTEFKIVNVVEPLLIGSPMAVLPSPILDEIKEKNKSIGSKLVKKVADELRRKLPNTIASELVLEGFPAETVVELANDWKADLIAMGSHARHGIKRLFLGSVSSGVLQHAPCSVLVMHTPSE